MFHTVRRTSNPAEILHGCRAGEIPACAAAASLLFLFCTIAPAQTQAEEHGMLPGAGQTVVAPAQKKQDNLYSDKEAGNRALADMEYGTAASFYRQYRLKAEQAGDTAAVRDAYACELDALILANLADSAQKLLDEYRKKITQLDEKSVKLWQAEIYLIRRKTDEADKLLKELIPSFDKLDPARLRALSCAAFVAELRGDLEQAARYYGDLATAQEAFPAGTSDVKKSFGRRAVERRALALGGIGKSADAFSLLQALPVADDRRDVDSLRLLRFYLTLSEKGPESLADEWNEIRSNSTPRKDNFFFLTACRIGDEFLRRDETIHAAEAYRLAYDFAAVREDAFTAMNRLMTVFDRLGQKKEAAELAVQMISFFKDVQVSSEFKLRVASVLFRAGLADEAFDVCLSCIPPDDSAAADREKAYRSALDVMIRDKAFPSAFKFIDSFDTAPENKHARTMDRAEVTWREKKPAEAARLYRSVGESATGALRQEALLNAMRCSRDAQQYQDMLDIAALLRKDDPEHPAPDVLLLSAVAQFHLNDMAAAARNYLDYEASVPKTESNRQNREQALFQAGQLLSGLGQPGEAAEVFRRLCQDYGMNDGSARYWLIHCLYASGDEIEAEHESWRFIDEKPDSQYAGAAALRLAEHYRGTGSVQHAEKTLNRLLDLEKYPKIQARAMYEKALIAYQRDDLASALEYLDRIDGSEPGNAPLADILYLRGDIARARNDFAGARTEYEAAAKAAAGTRLEQAALGSAADCIFAMAANPAPETAASAPQEDAAVSGNKPQAAPQNKDKTKDVQDVKDKEVQDAKDKGKDAQDAKDKDKSRETPAVKPAVPATPADNYRKAYEAYQALLNIKGLLPEYKAMAIYKSGQSLWKAGDEKAAFDLFKQMIYLLPAEDAAARPVESYWIFRSVEALESLAHKEPVISNVGSAVDALVWLGQTGMADPASIRQRIRALRKKQYQPPLPASSNTTITPESSQS